MEKADAVYALLRKIPKGKVATYKSIADALGMHPRAVAAALKMNKDPAYFPCYKVVHADGLLGGYSCEGGVKLKEELLRRDGIVIEKGKIPEVCCFVF